MARKERKRRSACYVLISRADGKPVRVWWGRFGARIEAKARGNQEHVVRATLEWSPPQRRS